MSLLEETQLLAKRYRLRPDTDRGQNFLIDETVVADSLRVGGIKPEDTVLEIGSGLGTLTTALARRVARVVGIESDRRLFPLLDSLTEEYENLTVIKNDFLKLEPAELYQALALRQNQSYKVVANIPYYITGKIISQLFSFEQLPTTIVLLVQKEVAEKIVAKAGDHSKQSLGVQFYGQAKVARIVSRKAFWPAPAVDSALLVIEQLHHWNYQAPEEEVWQLIRIGFSSRRKTLVNNLSAGLKLAKPEVEEWLLACKLSVKIRAQDLELSDWITLSVNKKL